MFRTLLSSLLFLTLALALIGTHPALCAADDPPAKENVPREEASVEDLEKEWDALVSRRDKLTKKLQILSEEYTALQPTAANPKGKDPKRVAEIQKEFQASVDEFNTKTTPRMEQILPTLAKAKFKTYLQNPKDKKAEEIVFNYLQMSYVAKQRYGEVAAIGKKLIDSGNKNPLILCITGASLFCEHKFEEAKSLLQQASKDKTPEGKDIFAQVGEKFLADCDDYIGYWDKEQKLRQAEAAAPDDKKNPHILLITTKGEIELELFEDQAPNTVANFISLVEKGKYDNVGFHRVIPAFMSQGGDPNTLTPELEDDGTGGPGYTIKCECNREDARMHFSGSLSMAHGGPDTGGSQFFLTHVPTSHLNNKHTVFGRVVKGLDLVKQFEVFNPEAPEEWKMDRIESAKVLNKRDHEYVPETEPEPKRSLK